MNKYLDYLPEKQETQSKSPMGIGKLLLMLIATFAMLFCFYWFDLPRGRSDGRIYIPLIVLPIFIAMGSVGLFIGLLQKRKHQHDEKPKAHEKPRR